MPNSAIGSNTKGALGNNGEETLKGKSRKNEFLGRSGVDFEDYLTDSKRQLLFEKIGSLNGRTRELLRDTLTENARKGNFIRIYPSRSSDQYDIYFGNSKPLHRIIYKLLFSEETMPSQPALSHQINHHLGGRVAENGDKS